MQSSLENVLNLFSNGLTGKPDDQVDFPKQGSKEFYSWGGGEGSVWGFFIILKRVWEESE